MSYKHIHDWKDKFLIENVQANSSDYLAYKNGGSFISSESTVICSGPAVYSASAVLVPIGLVQSATVQQQKQIQRLNEIGSRIPFMIPGRTTVGASLQRVLFDGPSLLYSTYIRGTVKNEDSKVILAYDNEDIYSPSSGTQGSESAEKPATYTGAASSIFGTEGVMGKNPNYNFMNLASSFFNRPMGLALVMFDSEGDEYGGFYLEKCYVQSHSFSVAAQQTILVEAIQITATTLVPISVEGTKN